MHNPDLIFINENTTHTDSDDNVLCNSNGFLIGCLNVQGILNKHDEICDLMQKCKFGVLGLCETFLDESIHAYVYKVN